MSKDCKLGPSSPALPWLVGLFRCSAKLGLFVFGLFLALFGFMLAVDAFLPKEKPVSAWGRIEELFIGCILFFIGRYALRRNRLEWKRRKEPG